MNGDKLKELRAAKIRFGGCEICGEHAVGRSICGVRGYLTLCNACFRRFCRWLDEQDEAVAYDRAQAEQQWAARRGTIDQARAAGQWYGDAIMCVCRAVDGWLAEQVAQHLRDLAEMHAEETG